MINLDIAHQRLHNQLVTQRRFEKPGDVVQWLGAVQAQDYAAADAIPNVVVRRVTRPDIPNAVGKNLEGDFWIIVPTWRGNTKGTRACTKRIGALKVCKSR